MLYLNRMHNYNYTDTYYYYVYKQHIITDNCHFSIPNSMEIWTKLISPSALAMKNSYPGIRHNPENARPIIQNSHPIPWSRRQKGRTASATQSVTFSKQSMLQWNILYPIPKGVCPTDFTWRKGKGICLPLTMSKGEICFKKKKGGNVKKMEHAPLQIP